MAKLEILNAARGDVAVAELQPLLFDDLWKPRGSFEGLDHRKHVGLGSQQLAEWGSTTSVDCLPEDVYQLDTEREALAIGRQRLSHAAGTTQPYIGGYLDANNRKQALSALCTVESNVSDDNPVARFLLDSLKNQLDKHYQSTTTAQVAELNQFLIDDVAQAWVRFNQSQASESVGMAKLRGVFIERIEDGTVVTPGLIVQSKPGEVGLQPEYAIPWGLYYKR